MMRRKTIGISAAAGFLTLALTLGGALSAQETEDSPMSGMMAMTGMMADCPMHSAMAESPRKVLEHRDDLGLSDEQVARLTVLEERADASRQAAMQRMRALHDDIEAASSRDRFDEGGLRAAFGRMGDMHAEMAIAMLRAARDAREILTPGQRETLAETGTDMMGMGGMMQMMQMMGGMHGMGGMTMEDCPMMHGGMMNHAEGATMPGHVGAPPGQQR